MKKADNFNANKWLVENKITTQSKLNEGRATLQQFRKYFKILIKQQPNDALDLIMDLLEKEGKNFDEWTSNIADDIIDTLSENKIKEGYEKPSEENVSEYWSNMINGQPEDVQKTLIDLTVGRMSYDDFVSSTMEDVYDSFRDELYDDED